MVTVLTDVAGIAGGTLPADRAPLHNAALDGPGRQPAGERSGLLLETKLHAPRVRTQWVQRESLVHRLASTRDQLVLIDAPAGFGKTILGAQWRASPQEDRAFAWLSLDGGDNDPVRLWRHVISAVGRASGTSGLEGALTLLRGPAPDIAGAFLPVLASELAALPAPVVLVLDDYDAIRDRGCQAQIGFLLRHLPPAVEAVLITRTERGLPLGRLRAAGNFTEIRMNDLRFSGREAAAVVRSVSGVSLTQPELAELLGRTEGWPAGVYLAALSLRDHPSPGGFIRQFTGSHRYIADFLMEEVVSRQPERIRKFLARTAILGRFTSSLCDAVTGAGDAAEIIDVLERENLFIIALDDERRWFRYHHLFAQMLMSQLTRAEPSLLPALHARASAWFQERGSLDEAVGHALAAGDAAATELIAAHWYWYVSAGRVATVTAWMRALGAERIHADPVAAHAAAWTAAFSGDRELVRQWLAVIEEAEQRPGALPDGMRSLRSSAALLRGMFGFGGLREMRESAAEAARLEDDPASAWYALARATWGWSLYLSGQTEQAQLRLRQALLATDLPRLARMLALAVMALVALDTDHVAEAEPLARAARDMTAADAHGQMSTQSALAHTAVGAVYARQGHMEEARREFERALGTRLHWVGVTPWVAIEAQLRLAAAMFELGDREVAIALLEDAGDLLSSTPDGTGVLRSRLERLGRRFATGEGVPEVSVLLTAQERRILGLLPGTLSRREIAGELHLSMNTVKTHIRMIYRKLGTRSRQQAVRRARALGLMVLSLGLLAGAASAGPGGVDAAGLRSG